MGFSIREDAKVISVADLALKHVAGKAGKDSDDESSASSGGSDSESDDVNPFQDRLKSMFSLTKPGKASGAAAKAAAGATAAAGGSSGRRSAPSGRGADGQRASRHAETPPSKAGSEAGLGSGGKSVGQKSGHKRDHEESDDEDDCEDEPEIKRRRGRPPSRKVADLSGAQTGKANAHLAEYATIKHDAAGLLEISDDCDMSMDGVKEAKKAQAAKGKKLEALLAQAKSLEKKVGKFDNTDNLLGDMPADLTDLIASIEAATFVIKNVFNDRVDVDRFILTMESVLETSKAASTDVGFVYFSKFMSTKCASAMRFVDMSPFVDLCTRDSIAQLGIKIDTDEKSNRARRTVSANIESACCALMSKVTARDIKKNGPSITFLSEFLDKLKGANLHASEGAQEQINQLSVIINAATSPVEDLMKLLSLIGCLPDDVDGADGVDLPDTADASKLPPLLRILSDHPIGESLLNAAGAEVKRRSEELKLRKCMEGCAKNIELMVENYSDISDEGFLEDVKKAPGAQMHVRGASRFSSPAGPRLWARGARALKARR